MRTAELCGSISEPEPAPDPGKKVGVQYILVELDLNLSTYLPTLHPSFPICRGNEELLLRTAGEVSVRCRLPCR